VRFINVLGVQGAFNAVNGTLGETGPAVDYLLEQLAGEITATELSTSLNDRINLIDGPASTTGTLPNQLALLQGQIDDISSYPDYDNATTYAAEDIVKYDGGLYKALSSTTGNLPTNATYWLKIGDYSSLADIVAAHTLEISTLITDTGAETTAREALATQMRGSYGGTDLSLVNSGLIFSERTARVTAQSAFASQLTALDSAVNNPATGLAVTRATLINDYSTTATVNSAIANSKTTLRAYTDTSASRTFRQTAAPTIRGVDADTTQNIPLQNGDVWIDTDDQNKLYQWSGSAWVYSPDGAITGSVTALTATLTNDYSTTTTVNTAIANARTSLRAYTDVSASRTFRQTAAPTKRGVDAETTLDIPLQSGDVWVDTDDQNKLYLWSGTAWVYSPDGTITGSLSALSATLTNDYLTATDTENAIAQSGTFLRAYADVQSKVFRTADAPTKRGVDPETAANISLLSGDVWYDINDSNKLYLWSGTAWVYSPDAVITGSVTTVDARVTTVENTRIGYCTIGGVASDNTNKAACEAAGGTWNVGIPIATAVKQVSVSDGDNSATLEQRFTAQKTLNNGLQAQYTIKLDVNGNVSGYGVYADATGSSEFIANVNRFAVTTPQSSIQVRATSTTYAQGAIARVVGQDSKTLVCKIGGTTGTGALTVGNIGSIITDGSITWQVASRVPIAVQAVPTNINGQPVPAGVYFDAGYILNATIQNAQIANLAVDDAKIVSLTAAKITAGSINVGEYIQSTGYITGSQGWKIGGNGVAEFAAASIRGQLVAAQINSRGLSILDAAGNIILNAGTGAFLGNVTGTVAGTSATTLVDTANAAIVDDARNVFTGSGGLAVGSLNWNTSGVRTSGFGVGITRAGIAAYNAAGVATFVLEGSTGAASFAGALSAATGTFSGSLTASAVDAVNTINIAGNAVTVPSSLSGEPLTTVNKNGYGVWQTIMTLNVAFGTAAAGTTVVLASVNLLYNSGSGQTASYIRVRETTTATATVDNGVTHSNSVQLTVLNAMRVSFTGTKTFVIEIAQLAGGATYRVGNTNITVLGAKK
jgi:glycosyltransferase A (GT-A) superfamily protein (DUF2064 family)